MLSAALAVTANDAVVAYDELSELDAQLALTLGVASAVKAYDAVTGTKVMLSAALAVVANDAVLGVNVIDVAALAVVANDAVSAHEAVVANDAVIATSALSA